MSIRNKIAKTMIGVGMTSSLYFCGHGAISALYYVNKLSHPEKYESSPKSLIRLTEIEKELNKEIKIMEINSSLVNKINKLKEERFKIESSKDYQRDKSIYTENIRNTIDYIITKDMLLAAGFLSFGLLGMIDMYFKKKEKTNNIYTSNS